MIHGFSHSSRIQEKGKKGGSNKTPDLFARFLYRITFKGSLMSTVTFADKYQKSLLNSLGLSSWGIHERHDI
jgi:hypothetical protein